MPPPELAISPKYCRQQIAGIVCTFCEGFDAQPFDCERNQVFHADVLPNHDSQVLDGKFAERNSTQSVTLGDEMGIECRRAPILTVELLQRFVAINLHWAVVGCNCQAQSCPVFGMR